MVMFIRMATSTIVHVQRGVCHMLSYKCVLAPVLCVTKGALKIIKIINGGSAQCASYNVDFICIKSVVRYGVFSVLVEFCSSLDILLLLSLMCASVNGQTLMQKKSARAALSVHFRIFTLKWRMQFMVAM